MPQMPVREPGYRLKIAKNVFELWPVPPMKSFSLTPLFAPAFGRAVRQIAITVQASGFLQSKEAESITLADIEALVTGGADAVDTKGLTGGQVLRDILMKYGPDLLGALGDTVGMMRPNDLTYLMKELLLGGECTVDGGPLYPVGTEDTRFNEVFKGKPLAIWRLLFFALQVNYADFSLALGGSDEKPSGANPSPASGTSGTNGPSGASSATGNGVGSQS